MYSVNVSSIQDFMQCRFRWWCKWVKNRVPRAGSPALDAGKLLHVIFEDHFQNGVPLYDAGTFHFDRFTEQFKDLAGPDLAVATKAAKVIDDMIGAFPLWEDKYAFTEILEVEQPFEIVLPEFSKEILWRGRPDVMGRYANKIWHRQNRGLASGMNFGTYLNLAKRHYHEHLYAEYAVQKYKKKNRKRGGGDKVAYGGTIFNLVRKLQYHTNVGKKNEKTKTAAEMFFTMPMSVDVTSPLHKSVMMAMVQHVEEMQWVEKRWNESQYIPAPNEKMNGGYGGNAEDPYFRVLIGAVSLDDDTVFKDREDTYAEVPSEA